MKDRKSENKKVKSIISIGIHLALILVVSWIIACTIGFLPPVIAVLPMLCGLFDAIIFMMMLKKNELKGTIIISGFILGITVYTMAPDGLMFWGTLIGALIGEIAYDVIGREKFMGQSIGVIGLFTGFAVGEYIPFVFMGDKYIAMYENNSINTQPIVEKCVDMFNVPLMIVLIVLTIPVTLLGCVWGKKIAERNKKK